MFDTPLFILPILERSLDSTLVYADIVTNILVPASIIISILSAIFGKKKE